MTEPTPQDERREEGSRSLSPAMPPFGRRGYRGWRSPTCPRGPPT